MQDAKSGRVHILRQLAVPGGVATEDTGNHLLLSLTREASAVGQAAKYQAQGFTNVKVLKAESRRGRLPDTR